MANTKTISRIMVLSMILIYSGSFARGLKFFGNEHPIDNRTSYNVFANKSAHFEGQMRISFDIALYPQTQIGYIFRIKNAKNSKKIYNLFYDAQGDDHIFRLNEEGFSSLITARIDRNKIPDAQWNKMEVVFDLDNDSLKLTINNNSFSAANVQLPHTISPILVFGKNDHIIDVPTIAIKNLVVGDKNKYTFPLDESDGTEVHDSNGNTIGVVTNPYWLINDFHHWQFETEMISRSVAGSNYNDKTQEIYYFNRDTLHKYNVWSKQTSTIVFNNRCPVSMKLGTNFTGAEKLYAYEVYPESIQDSTTVASLDLQTNLWRSESTQQLPTQLHHHGSYIDHKNGLYTIFGGFGNMYYSNKFFSFDQANKTWAQTRYFSGELPCPRYFSSVGYLEKNNSVYVFGGMGNQSGEQVVGRNYFYDLYKIDLTTKKAEKLWEINLAGPNVVPVRGMIILDDTHFYTLCYPESFTDSFMRLYRFSISSGECEILGDSIPIHSDKITTNANIYYDRHLKSLYVTVQEFDDDISSRLKVYSLAFPPITSQELSNYEKNRAGIGWYFVAALCIMVLGGGYFFVRRQKAILANNKEKDAKRLNNQSASTTRANAIYLFGDFMVRDRNNKDITYMFSAKLKQTLCLILQYSTANGISSQRLSNLLWPYKPEDKVKNTRGVTINHLRKTLSELDGIELIYEKGCFKVVCSDAFYCDYIRCMEVISNSSTKNSNEVFVQILGRGKFLKFSDEPLFDSMKEQLERTLDSILHSEMNRLFAAEDYVATSKLAQAIFNIDPHNEEAFAIQIKAMLRLKLSEEALIKYQSFVVEYNNAIGKEYPHPFKSFKENRI